MENGSEKLQIIMNLMEELQEEMGYGAEDLGERLGRPKPALEVAKVEVGMDEMPEDEMMMEEEGPEDKLKKRLMKLRA